MKKEHSTITALNKAKHKHADALEGETKAEEAALVRTLYFLPRHLPLAHSVF